MKLHSVTRLNGSRTWCGPAALSAITGWPVEKAVEKIKQTRWKQTKETASFFGRSVDDYKDPFRAVKGVSCATMGTALYMAGYRVKTLERYGLKPDAVPPSKQPSLAFWFRKRADRNAMCLVNVTGHFIVVKGNKFVDNCYVEPTFISKAPHRRVKVRHVYKVWKEKRNGREAKA